MILNKRNTSRLVVRTLSGCFFLALLMACGDGSSQSSSNSSESSKSPDTTRAAVHRLELSEAQTTRRWSAQVLPIRTVDITAPRAGQIAEVLVHEGEIVDEGTPLLRVAEPEIAARMQVLQEREEALAEDLQRWIALAEDEAAGPAEVRQARLRLLEVREDLLSLRAQRAPTLRAPARGAVVEILGHQGAFVQAGVPLLRFVEHQPVVEHLASVSDAPYLARSEDLRISDARGQNAEISRTVLLESESPQTLRVRHYLQTPDTELLYKAVDVIHETSSEVFLIPWTALATEEGTHWVGRLTGDPPEVERRDVELGRAYPRGIEVLSGLEAEDLILRYDPRSLGEGRKIEAVEGRR